MGSLSELVDVVTRERGALVMGVLNVTPDSFYDGGRYLEPRDAREQVDAMLSDGVDIIDIGAESTRPGSDPVSADEQLRRAEPVVAYAAERGAAVSIDTQSPSVARRALRAGALLVNDVSCLANPELAQVTAEENGHLMIMHSRGAMADMPGFSRYPDAGYDDIVAEVIQEWQEARERAVEVGMRREHIWFDPGLGFHKNASQSAELLRRLGEFQCLGAKIATGPSRKSFIGALDGTSPEHRLGGSIAACLRSVEAGAVLVRVHDVQPVRQALIAQRAFAPRRRGATHA